MVSQTATSDKTMTYADALTNAKPLADMTAPTPEPPRPPDGDDASIGPNFTLMATSELPDIPRST